jgi:hypothetical protein
MPNDHPKCLWPTESNFGLHSAASGWILSEFFGALSSVEEYLVYTKIAPGGPMLPSGGLTWTKPCKNRCSVRFRVDPLGPIYPPIVFTG